MTDTVRKAADILYQRSGVEGHAAQTACQEHAQALHDAGLLAPELPEPTLPFSDGTKGWFVEDDEGRDIGSIYIFNGEILLRTAAGRVKGAPSQMRKIALALLAATNHAQENQ